MDLIYKIGLGILAVFLIFYLVTYLKANPKSLSRESLSKSFNSMGLLALGLIAFITLIVWLLRAA